MVFVPVADDQGVGHGGIDFQAFEIVRERVGVSAKSTRICFSSAPRKDSK